MRSRPLEPVLEDRSGLSGCREMTRVSCTFDRAKGPVGDGISKSPAKSGELLVSFAGKDQGRRSDRTKAMPGGLLAAGPREAQTRCQPRRIVHQSLRSQRRFIVEIGEDRLGEPSSEERVDVVLLDDRLRKDGIGLEPSSSFIRVVDSCSRADQDQAIEMFRASEGQRECHTTSEGVAEQIESAITDRLEDGVRGSLEIGLDVGRTAVSGKVDRQYSMVLSKQVTKGPPRVGSLGETMEYDEQWTVAPRAGGERRHDR